MPAFLPSPQWAAQVAAATPLPDARLTTRLERLLLCLADKPLDAFPQACPNFHQAKATYRFLANERFGPSDLLAGWQTVTTQAMADQPLIYIPHDTTTFSYTSLKHTTGLGYISAREAPRGIQCHTSLVVQSQGIALGVLHQHYWIRTPFGSERPHGRPIEAKESMKWLHGVHATATALQTLPACQRPRVIHLLDQEGDLHDGFAKMLSLGHGAIIRRCHARTVAEEPGKADDAIRWAPVVARLRLQVPAGHGRQKRTALVELRARPLTLAPHCHRERDRKPLALNMVEVREVVASADVEEPIHGRLWTTEPARTKKQILAVVRGYLLRWRIEDFHLIWKQGCRVQALPLETRQRLEKALVMYAGVAVRLLRLRDLARQEPTTPCTEVLSEDEWRALYTHTQGEAATTATAVPSVVDVTKWIGRLGGHLGRKRDGLAGVRTLWRGWRDLAILVAGYRAGKQP
jgi:hypothetical protein